MARSDKAAATSAVKAKHTAARSRLEVLAERVVVEAGFPEPVREHRFIPGRDHRWDLAWPDQRIAIEVQGGTWSGGRHVRGSGYEIDCRKMTAGQVLGWTVLYATERMLRRGDTVAALRGLFGQQDAAEAVAEIFPPNPSRQVRRHGELTRAILAHLDGGPTLREIIDRSGIAREDVGVALVRMASTGKIERDGTPGRYRYWRAGEFA